ncbi:MAG TPA: TlpA disulfide reductase family protein [Steroidobacteraceae bacterium]|jgi:thiol-disulfide isomerase/thioredoxin|nr:TlpA disulfide reductase family protein [Steroidobacteraceae bacterium]
MKASAYVAVAAIAVAAGVLVYRYAVVPDTAKEATTAQAEQPTAAEEPAAMPETLPDFTLGDLAGKPTSIRSWPGKSLIVNFWATWCGPCRREIPLLRELQKQHGAEGFQIVGVAVDIREDVIKYAQEIGIDYPILIGEQDGLDAVNKFGQGSIGFPFTVFTDNQRRIVLFHLGEIRKEQAEILFGAVRDVNSGKLTPAAARVVAAKQLAALAPEPTSG